MLGSPSVVEISLGILVLVDSTLSGIVDFSEDMPVSGGFLSLGGT